MERVRAVIDTPGKPSELRERATALLAELGEERRALLAEHEKVNAKIGKAANRLAAGGMSYEKQAIATGIDRNSLYRSGGDVDFGSVTVPTRERNRLISKLIDLAPDRLAALDAVNTNSKAMRELVYWAHHELGLRVYEITNATGLHRSSTYGWIRNPDEPPVPTQRKSSRRPPPGAGHVGKRKKKETRT